MNLTLIHESCLPGYSLRDKKCECEEGSKNTLFCYPDKKGILLAVSNIISFQFPQCLICIDTK